MATNPVSWATLMQHLDRWRRDGDQREARLVAEFLERNLRASIPRAAHRSVPDDLIDEVLVAFLGAVLNGSKTLPDGSDPERYLRRSFRNAVIDRQRQLIRGEKEVARFAADPSKAAGPDLSVDERIALRERNTALLNALQQLPLADRVALKAVDVPEYLDPDELAWLAAQSGRSVEATREAVVAAVDVYEITLIFDPTPPDPSDRRKRMERFRKRRERAALAMQRLLAGAAE